VDVGAKTDRQVRPEGSSRRRNNPERQDERKRCEYDCGTQTPVWRSSAAAFGFREG
jgi:hypothetical protein